MSWAEGRQTNGRSVANSHSPRLRQEADVGGKCIHTRECRAEPLWSEGV